MSDVTTVIPKLILTKPVPDRDAIFALGWFNSKDGRDTLLKMGNTPQEISTPSLEEERTTIAEFLTLESEGKQKTWMIRHGEVTIGAAWVDLIKNHGVNAPSIHLMIGNSSYRGKGIGRATMNAMITYLKNNGNTIVYSRHLINNEVIDGLSRSLGFVTDGLAYIDENGLEWQNIRLSLEA